MAAGQGCFNKLGKFFKMNDGFGVQMQMRIGKESHYKTTLSGFIFLSYLAMSLGFIFWNFYYFVTRQIYTYSFYDKNNLNKMNLYENKFAFSFSLEYNNGTIAHDALSKYLDYEVQFISLDLDEGIVTNKKITTEKLSNKCDAEDMYTDNDFTEEYLQRRGVLEHLCPSKNNMRNFNLTGIFTQNYYTYISLNVMIKDEYFKNINEIRKLINDNPVRSNIYFVDTDIDYGELNKPMVTKLNFHYQYIDVDFYKKVDLDFSLIKFKSDQQIIGTEYTLFSGMKLTSTRDYFYNLYNRQSVEDASQNRNMMTYFIQSSPTQVDSIRKYQKLTEIVADMGGIISQVVLVLIAVFGHVNEKKAYQKIMNKTMKFKGRKNFNINSLKNILNHVPNSPRKNTQLPGNQKDDCKKLEKHQKNSRDAVSGNHSDNRCSNRVLINFEAKDKGLFKKKHGLKGNLQKSPSFNFNHVTPLKLTTGQLFCSIFCTCCYKRKLKTAKMLIEKGEEKICNYMDILTYIKKMHEIDVLKCLLFSDEQLRLFNFVSLPNVGVVNEHSPLYKNYEAEKRMINNLDKQEAGLLKKSYMDNMGKDDNMEYVNKLLNLFRSEIESLNLS